MSDFTEERNISFLDFLIRPGDVHEVRAFEVRKKIDATYSQTVYGFYDDREKMVIDSANLDGGCWDNQRFCPGVYITVNPVDPTLLARANNRLLSCKGEGLCAKDANVIRRSNLFLDLDPRRAGHGSTEVKKIMATQTEKRVARETSLKIMSWFKAIGMPRPAALDSGNGVQMISPLDWELSEDDDDLIKRFLEFLDHRFGSEECHLDLATVNRSRICRFPGTWNRKGDEHEDRRHRRTEVLSVPDRLPDPLTRQIMESVAPAVKKAQAAPRFNPFVHGDFAALGIEDVQDTSFMWTPEKLEEAMTVAQMNWTIHDLQGDVRRYKLCPCPFNQEHTGPRDGMVFLDVTGETVGKVGFSCFHAGCHNHHWPEFRALLKAEEFHVRDDFRENRASDHPDHDDPIISASTPVVTAGQILDARWTTQAGRTLHQRGRSWWEWDGTRYLLKEDEDIRATVYDRLGRCSERIKVGKEYEDRPFRVDPTKVNNVVDALRSLCLAPVADMPTYLGDDPSFPAPTSLIALQNGLLDIDAYLKGDPCLRPHTPLWFSENCLPFAFDPEATCPTWDRFIPDVMSDDEESSVWLQKWVGLQLVPDLSHQVITFLPGTGGNGKGVFLDVLQALLGRHNYCTPTFSSICERFGRSEFSGKLSAIMGDAHLGRETDAIRALEFLKSVSGGTPVNLEEKGKPMRSGIRLNARFTIAVNILPRLPDASRALGRRIRIIPFHRNYTANPDKTLGERMISNELPGILLWALEGLRKLKLGATLDQPAVGESIRADFIDDSSPISAFIENYCEVDPEYSEEKAIFRHALNLWLEQAGHKPMADSTISRQIRANNSRIDTDRKRRVDGKPKPIFVGIRLNADGRALNIISDFRSGHYLI